MGEGVPGRALERREPQWSTDWNVDPFGQEKRSTVKSLLSLPLVSFKGEPLGVINAASIELREELSEVEMETAATFATRAALALENAFAHHHQREKIRDFEGPPDHKKAA